MKSLMGKISVEERNGYISEEIKVNFMSDITLNEIKWYISKRQRNNKNEVWVYIIMRTQL